MAIGDHDLMLILGLGLTLSEYEERFLHGERPYFETQELVFECTHCGACCDRPGVVYLTDRDIEVISAHLRMTPQELCLSFLQQEDGQWLLEVDDDDQCPFFKDERCTIHAVKPQQCQTYPFWPEIVGTAQSWLAESIRCPGIGRGPAYSAADVRALLLGKQRTP